MSRIFISYRRSISRYSANAVHAFCVSRFGRGSVFIDTETIQPGELFPNRISQAIEHCEVFLPLIGRDWHMVADQNRLRLHEMDDWVRREISGVLRRNRDRVPGSQNPVLIVPLIENGAVLPRQDELPEELRSLLEIASVNYTSVHDLELIVGAIEEHLGTAPMGEAGMRAMARRPDPSRQDQHRFRYVRKPVDLEPFVTLSDGEAAIAGANPGLFGEQRWDLYDRWCQWTARDARSPWHGPSNSVKSFLVLDQKQEDDAWLPIGVSIMLPLTLEGGRRLRLITRNRPSFSEKRNAANLESEDLAREGSKRLLLDSWIIRPRIVGGQSVRRFEHHNWGVGLALRHIAEFWDPDLAEEFTFLCEPDNPKIAAILNDLRFYEENRNAASGNLFVLKYPLDEDKYDTGDRESIERVIENIRSIRDVPIE